MATKESLNLYLISKMFKEYVSGDIEKQAEVLKNKAEEIAKLFGSDKTSKHQIRKHFHRLLDIKERMKADDSDNIKKFLPEIAMTSAYATYDRSRNRIGVAFEKFLKEFTNEAVKADKKKFFDLMTLFEAIVGYSNMYVSKN
ncbi:type III-A CRISPR-associated protein Csm2 [Desulfurobacterium indicum]|uniref:CRISPR system Cms protein Csm2 n=1 Tax=Desulfurobacterium indicum TaxID=1914305 RepID=A0A1R1MKU9_9BACT|nr:type III-A CRISPR-associated protein Csm2 [Desulfurobacterium indicum]OMH40389.1 type III-A CRISPR-associated protein Csm2 [Desulfurobacterium indicum]